MDVPTDTLPCGSWGAKLKECQELARECWRVVKAAPVGQERKSVYCDGSECHEWNACVKELEPHCPHDPFVVSTSKYAAARNAVCGGSCQEHIKEASRRHLEGQRCSGSNSAAAA